MSIVQTAVGLFVAYKYASYYSGTVQGAWYLLNSSRTEERRQTWKTIKQWAPWPISKLVSSDTSETEYKSPQMLIAETVLPKKTVQTYKNIMTTTKAIGIMTGLLHLHNALSLCVWVGSWTLYGGFVITLNSLNLLRYGVTWGSRWTYNRFGKSTPPTIDDIDSPHRERIQDGWVTVSSEVVRPIGLFINPDTTPYTHFSTSGSHKTTFGNNHVITWNENTPRLSAPPMTDDELERLHNNDSIPGLPILGEIEQ